MATVFRLQHVPQYHPLAQRVQRTPCALAATPAGRIHERIIAISHTETKRQTNRQAT